MKTSSLIRGIMQCTLLSAALMFASQNASSQTPAPAWGQAQYFKYNIENVLVNKTAIAGQWNVKVVFSVTDPTTGLAWNIWEALPYQSVGAGLTIDIGWDSTEFSNTGSVNSQLTSVTTTVLGTGAAMPVQLRNLNNNREPLAKPPTPGKAKPCLTTAQCPDPAPSLGNRFYVEQLVTPVTFGQTVAKGRVGMEGHPVCNGLSGCPSAIAPFANIPVRSATADFAFLDTGTPTVTKVADPRRPVVDFETKCKTCHNDKSLDRNGLPIPRLSLHGGNRNENLKLCVMCHNPNQTDVPYRTSGPETPLDFKTMIHSIHSAGFREQPFIVIGFGASINDFSDIRFPATLSNCLNCHVQLPGGKGTFELPLASSVLGTTVKTGSTYAVPAGGLRTISVDPADDLKITPTAATCSGCHDKAEVRSHMIKTGGASFSTLQQNIGVTVKERCASCHGPGKEKDVSRVHEISSKEGFYH